MERGYPVGLVLGLLMQAGFVVRDVFDFDTRKAVQEQTSRAGYLAGKHRVRKHQPGKQRLVRNHTQRSL